MNERSKRILAGLVLTLGLVTVVDVTVGAVGAGRMALLFGAFTAAGFVTGYLSRPARLADAVVIGLGAIALVFTAGALLPEPVRSSLLGGLWPADDLGGAASLGHGVLTATGSLAAMTAGMAAAMLLHTAPRSAAHVALGGVLIATALVASVAAFAWFGVIALEAEVTPWHWISGLTALGLASVAYGFRLFLERPATTGRIIPAVAADRDSERMRPA